MSDLPRPTSYEAESVYGIEHVIRPIQSFFENKLVGAGLLMLATVVALVWANSPWAESYEHLLHTEIALIVGDFTLSKTAVHWLNDGLMGVFFFVVGLEIKRELLVGELSSVRKATLPIVAALGGMLMPAALYLLINREGAGVSGWGIPMTTDIAFALGVLSLVSGRVPPALTIFLTALAIVDDIGGILVIALFYTEEISLWSLAIGGGLLGVSMASNRLGVRSPIFYFLIGIAVWLAFLKSGVHATLAAVLMAFTIPARTRIHRERFVTRMTLLLDRFRRLGVSQEKGLLDHEQEDIVEEMGDVLDRATAPLQRLEAILAPIATFLVLPLFALGNAGVALGEGLLEKASNPISLGIVLGLVLGKQVGIVGSSWAAVKLGLADRPEGVSWRALHAVSVLGGIGFTMALFIGGLAFPDPATQEVVKVGILAASLVSALLGLVLLYTLPARKEL